MAKSIEEISASLGIKGTSGSFDFEADQKASRLLEDTRALTAGGIGAAGPDPRIAAGKLKQKKQQVQKLKKGKQETPAPALVPLAPLPNDVFREGIFNSEASVKDRNDRSIMTAYFSKSSGEYSIGPGLNMDSTLVQKSLAKRGFDAQAFKDIYDFKSTQEIDPELVPLMNDVFNDVIEGSRKDARTFVGIGTWNKLKKNEQDAISDMSYNLGLSKLGGFKKMKKAIEFLANNRSPEALSSVTEQMIDSGWFNQVGNRAIKVINQFHNGGDEPTQRWLQGINSV